MKLPFEINTIGVVGQYIVFDNKTQQNTYKSCDLKLTIMEEDGEQHIKVHTIFHEGIWTQWANLQNQIMSVTELSRSLLEEHNMKQSEYLDLSF